MRLAPQLAEDVFFCVAQGHGMFLDLKRDAYSAIALPVRDLGWDGVGCEDLTSLAGLIAVHHDPLLEAGLITPEGDPGAPPTGSPCIARPTAHILGLADQRAFGFPGQRPGDRRVSWIDWFEFLAASQSASRSLKTRHISDIVHAVRRRKADAGKRPTDFDALRRETLIFGQLRPWYPRDYLCLFDALALLEFLARRQLYPTWVFGVQAQPFGAHCWLQAGAFLLNEGTEYANQFTPIMAI
jgi:Transglutaminase-like superfamily